VKNKIGEIKPLSSTQIKELMSIQVGEKKTGRIMVGDKSVGLSTGMLYGGNIIYHFFYWEKPKDFFKKAISFLEENNPDFKFHVKYSS
jgi:hypothetical protein